MRTHLQIIEDAGGPTALARAIDVPVNNVKQWKLKRSIPAAHWIAVEAARISTLAELAHGATARAHEAKALAGGDRQ